MCIRDRGREHWFLAGLMLSLASDIADGQIARRFNLATELGSRLDSWADLLTYTVVPLAVWWLRPALVVTEKVVFFTACLLYTSVVYDLDFEPGVQGRARCP